MLEPLHRLGIAIRSLRRTAGFTLTAVVVLAVGIAPATAVYTVAEAFLLRPLPILQQERVIELHGASRDGTVDEFPLLLDDARAFAERAQSLERTEFTSWGGAHFVPIRDEGSVFRMRRSLVSGGYFDLLGTQPLIGRALTPDDDREGAAPVAVLSHGAWQRSFGGDPSIVGESLILHETGDAHRIVGVMPLGLDFPQGTDFWAPVLPNSPVMNGSPYAELNAIGRLRPGAQASDAGAELTAYFARPDAPLWHRDLIGTARPISEAILGDVRPALLAFAVAAALLLLITCINVANLLLVRGLARVREMAIRTALGASRGRVVAQLLAESALLATMGGALGMLLAAAGVRAFIALAPAGTPRLDEIDLGGPIVAGAIGITALATIIFSLAPALFASRPDAKTTLRAGSRQSGAGRGFRLGTEALIAGQVALTIIVLSAAALISRSLFALERAELALEPERLLFVELALPALSFGETGTELAILDRLIPEVAAIPGVQSVTPVLTLPFAETGGITGRLHTAGQAEEEQVDNPALTFEVVMPGYLQTMGIPLLRGRGITEQDNESAPRVALLSESAAEHFWPGEDPIGKRLEGGDEPVTIVGIVPHTRYRDLRSPHPSIYFPLRQSTFPVAPTTLAVRTTGEPALLTPTVRRVVAGTEPGVAVANAAPFEALRDAQLTQPRLNALLLAAFALAATLLAAVGLYATMATMVRQRTREIGVRLALGSTAPAVGRLILRRGVTIGAIGTAVGIAVAMMLNRGLEGLLYGLSATDPVTLLAAAGGMLAISAISSLIPARAGAKVDPVVALRAD